MKYIKHHMRDEIDAVSYILNLRPPKTLAYYRERIQHDEVKTIEDVLEIKKAYDEDIGILIVKYKELKLDQDKIKNELTERGFFNGKIDSSDIENCVKNRIYDIATRSESETFYEI